MVVCEFLAFDNVVEIGAHQVSHKIPANHKWGELAQFKHSFAYLKVKSGTFLTFLKKKSQMGTKMNIAVRPSGIFFFQELFAAHH